MSGLLGEDTTAPHFKRMRPHELAGRFNEIQALRDRFYTRVFGERPPDEITHFVNRLTLAKWSDPGAAVGNTARHGQARTNPLVVAAFDDHSDEIVGFAYAAENVSSRLEPKLTKLHVPSVIAQKVGDKERSKKVQQNKQYVWGSEIVYEADRAPYAPVIGALLLKGFDADLQGTWYPWKEEVELKQLLEQWGYVSSQDDPELVYGNRGFGFGTKSAYQERWVIPRIGDAVAAIQAQPGMEAIIAQSQDELG